MADVAGPLRPARPVLNPAPPKGREGGRREGSRAGRGCSRAPATCEGWGTEVDGGGSAGVCASARVWRAFRPSLPRNRPAPGRERLMCLCVCAREKGAVGVGVKETLVRRKGESVRACVGRGRAGGVSEVQR